VPRFIYVSTVENNLPSFFLRGYFEGKRRAEEALLSAFPAAGAGVVLRPSFMYGSRTISKDVSLPLGLLGRPLEAVLNNKAAAWLREAVPGMLALLAPPISVDAVASAVVRVAEGEEQARALCANPPHSQRTNILSRDDIALVAAIQS
jgi:nucleoside-diphosphate-sugar epimerase